MTAIDQKLLDALATLDTPTVCNALEEIDPKHRDRGFTTAPLVCPFPNLKPIVGFARTAMIRAMRPGVPAGPEKRVAYYEYVSKGDLPRITVIQVVPREGYYWDNKHGQVVAGATVAVPHGTALSKDLRIGVDGGKAKVYRYAFCDANSCYARIGLLADDIAAFKKGSAAKLVLFHFEAQDKPVELTLSLSGFTAGFEATRPAAPQQ